MIDRNNNVALDIYLLGESKEYWIEVGASDGPKIEEFDYDNTALDGLIITDVTGFDFDSNSNEDIVFQLTTVKEMVICDRSKIGRWHELGQH